MAKIKTPLIATLVAGALAAGSLPVVADSHTAPRYTVEASDARVNRSVTGDVSAEVQGVPAQPVHSFTWDGEGSTPIEGSASLEVDPAADTGEIDASWTDEHGGWTFLQTMFAAPPHPSGLKVGPGAETTELIEGDPITTNVYLHGDTTAGEAVLPTLFTYLTTWGPAEVTLNGEPFENPFDGPTPMWAAHTMTTVGVRAEDGTVGTVDGDIFDPVADPTNGATDGADLEFHIVFHDVPGPDMTDNFPPPLDFFYHLTFEDVKVEIG